MKIPVILGPTSSGKTTLGMEICRDFEGEILSADSRQVYKYMDVGTGKVPVGKEISYEQNNCFWILDGIKVWGYDVVDPDEYFSAYDYAKFGLNKASEIMNRGVNLVIAGGTGLYIDFLTGRIKDLSGPPDMDLRKKLEERDLSDLQQEVTSLNIKLNRSDFNNKYRLVRVLERENSSKSSPPLPYLKNVSFVYIGLTGPRSFLYQRVDNWVGEIWEDDLILEEIEELLSLGYGDTAKLEGLVYQNALAFYEGKKSREEAIQRTKFNLHAYIRRQQTYFKRILNVKWFDISKDNYPENLYNYFKNA